MAYKILENNGIEIENTDGGALNNLSAGNKSGIVGGVLSECLLSATGNSVIVSPGLLLLRGVRIKITEPESISVASVPSADTLYQVVAQVTATDGFVIEFSLFAQIPGALTQDSMYTTNAGTYQMELGRFTHKSDGTIVGVERVAEVIYYGGFPDAPKNGGYYARKNGAWANVAAGSGFEMPVTVWESEVGTSDGGFFLGASLKPGCFIVTLRTSPTAGLVPSMAQHVFFVTREMIEAKANVYRPLPCIFMRSGSTPTFVAGRVAAGLEYTSGGNWYFYFGDNASADATIRVDYSEHVDGAE